MFKTHVIKMKCSTKGCGGVEPVEILPEYYHSIAKNSHFWRDRALCQKCRLELQRKRAEEFKNFSIKDIEKLL